jgi:hypothetical protein
MADAVEDEHMRSQDTLFLLKLLKYLKYRLITNTFHLNVVTYIYI